MLMKIVHVIDFFHPNAGYQLNVLSKYIVNMGYEDYIITGELKKVDKSLTQFFGEKDIEIMDREYEHKTGVKIIRLPLRAYISGRAIYYRSLRKTIDKLRPDILFVHDIDTFVGINTVWKVPKLAYPVVFNSTMLEMASTNRFRNQYRWFYKKFVTPRIIKYGLKTIRIQDDDYLERCLGIPIIQCPFISVGSDTLLFHPNDEVKKKFRADHHIKEDDFVIIYTGKLIESKGAKLLAHAFENKFNSKSKRNVVLIVVGNANGAYGLEVEDIFKKSENKVIRYPTQKYMDLAKFYQAADISIFPKECSLSFYDAQACGLPVLSENNNVNTDRLKYNNGKNFEKESLSDLRDKIVEFLEMSENDFKTMSNNAYKFVKENYDYKNIAEQYMEVLLEEHRKFKLNL